MTKKLIEEIIKEYGETDSADRWEIIKKQLRYILKKNLSQYVLVDKDKLGHMIDRRQDRMNQEPSEEDPAGSLGVIAGHSMCLEDLKNILDCNVY